MKSKSELALIGVGALMALGMAASCGAAVGNHSERGTSVTEVRLSDGTLCAVMDTTNGPAISCVK